MIFASAREEANPPKPRLYGRIRVPIAKKDRRPIEDQTAAFPSFPPFFHNGVCLVPRSLQRDVEPLRKHLRIYSFITRKIRIRILNDGFCLHSKNSSVDRDYCRKYFPNSQPKVIPKVIHNNDGLDHGFPGLIALTFGC